MKTEWWDRACAIFLEALDRDPEERDSFVEKACGEDVGLVELVTTLLEGHESGPLNELPEGMPSDVGAAVREQTRHTSPGSGAAGPGLTPSPDDRYRILRELGRGGMGVVYLAYDRALDRLVSLKRLHPVGAAEAISGTLLAEARAAAALDHPNISPVFDVNTTSDGTPFMILAYYPGEALSKRLERGSLSTGQAVAIALATARGLEAAHQIGIVHRDIKPSNVLLTESGGVRLLDFGIASRTTTGQVGPGPPIGTLAYMSPEQRSGASIDHRTDLWSLGVMLFEMLTGFRPFGPEGSESQRLPLPPQAGHPCHDRIERILDRALQRDPNDRYANAREVVEDLASLPVEESARARGAVTGTSDTGGKAGAGPRRFLAAIMFIDMVGYSALMRGDEAQAYEARRRYRDALAAATRNHDGEIIQHYGDGAVTVFRSAVDGVKAAIDIQREVRSDPAVPLRIGLHVGDVTRDWEGVYGDGVNVAARVEAACPAGSVLVSGTVAREIRNQRDLNAHSLGRVLLKNIDGPVELFALDHEGLHVPARAEVDRRLRESSAFESSLETARPSLATHPAGVPPTAESHVPQRVTRGSRVLWAIAALVGVTLVALLLLGRRILPPRPGFTAGSSIAVLPLTPIGSEADTAFVDGLHESILTQLSHVPDLAVISRNSVLAYRGSPQPVPVIASELDVEAVLEGSVQRVGDQIRVRMQLIDASRDVHIWSAEYDRQYRVDEIFGIQSDIAKNVARALSAELLPAVQAEIDGTPTENVQALEHYFRGNILYAGRYERAQAEEAIREFERATSLDPEFSQAWAALAKARIWMFWQFPGTEDEKASARIALDRAIELAPTDVETRLAQGQYQYRGERDYRAALQHFQAAAAVRPNDAMVVLALGAIYRRTGDWEEAATAFERATRLAPNDPVGTYTAATTYTLQRRFEDALRHVERLARFTPPAAHNGPLMARWEVLNGVGDTAAMGRLIERVPADAPVLRDRFTATLAFYQRRYEAAMALGAPLFTVPFIGADDRLLSLAQLADLAGDATTARIYADSARLEAEEALRLYTGVEAAVLSDTHGRLGMAHAFLDNAEEALRHGEAGVRALPISRDAYTGRYGALRMAFIHLELGRLEDAESEFAYLASVPSDITAPLLRLDPRFDPIRGRPTLQALLGRP